MDESNELKEVSLDEEVKVEDEVKEEAVEEEQPQKAEPDIYAKQMAIQNAQVSKLIERLDAPVQAVEKQVEPEDPDIEDSVFIDKPVEVTKKIAAHEAQKYMEKIEAKIRSEMEAKTRVEHIRNKAEQAWNRVVQMNPELGREGSAERELWAQFYYGKDGKGKLNIFEDGVELATAAYRDAKHSYEKQLEAARKKRVEQGAMTGSGKGKQSSNVFYLDDHAKLAAKRMGLSEQKYAEIMKGVANG